MIEPKNAQLLNLAAVATTQLSTSPQRIPLRKVLAPTSELQRTQQKLKSRTS